LLDIVLPPLPRYRRWLNRWPWLFVLPLALLLWRSFDSPVLSYQAQQLLTVQQGAFMLQSNVSGELFSQQQRLLTSPVPATVVSLLQRPGAEVQPDTILLQLENPELAQQVDAAKRQVQQKQAELQAFAALQQQELLLQQDQLSERLAAEAAAELEFDAHMALEKRGVVSQLELRRTALKFRQHQAASSNANTRLQQFKQMQQAQSAQRELELQQLQSSYQLLLTQQQQLTVRAGISGLVQQLDVEIGQAVPAGAALARIGSQQQLSARLWLPERHAAQIQAGALVKLELAGEAIAAQITRVEAVVNEGMVMAEAKPMQNLPSGARPAQRLRAQVDLAQLPTALYLPYLSSLLPNQQQPLFVLQSDQQAVRREVQLGEISGEHILVKSGLNPGEKVLSAVPAHWLTFDTIALAQEK
jgi:HlyD family secretion protein